MSVRSPVACASNAGDSVVGNIGPQAKEDAQCAAARCSSYSVFSPRSRSRRPPPSPCYLVNAGDSSTFNSYRVKHNPAVYFDDVEGPGGTWSPTPSAECVANDIPMGGTGPNDTSAFDASLASGNVGGFNFIVPNQC